MDNGDWGDTDSDGEAGIPHAAAAASVLDAWLADHHGTNSSFLSSFTCLLLARLHLCAADLLVSVCGNGDQAEWRCMCDHTCALLVAVCALLRVFCTWP